MTKVRHLAEGSPLPEWFLDALQELLSTYASPNFAVTQVDATTLQVVASTNNGQVGVCLARGGVTGWRYNTATVTASPPGGLAAGDHDIYVVGWGNAFSSNPTPPPSELDSTIYGFTLMLLQSGVTPSGSPGTAQELYRKVGTFYWTGSAIATVTMSFGGAGATTGIPVGGVIDWPWDSANIPAWSALPYGQSVLRASYPLLDSIASPGSYAAWGSADGTHFTLPDLRGVVTAGKDNMGGTAANRITAAISGTAGTVLGALIGTEGIVLTTAQLPAHNHTTSHSLTLPSHTHSVGGNPGGPTSGGNNAVQQPDAPITPNAVTVGGPDSFPGIPGSVTVDNTGSGSAHRNLQPTVIVNKIIRLL